jgi:hypothetical protein
MKREMKKLLMKKNRLVMTGSTVLSGMILGGDGEGTQGTQNKGSPVAMPAN